MARPSLRPISEHAEFAAAIASKHASPLTRRRSLRRVGSVAGLKASDWSWCPAFINVDLDDYEDIIITTGHWRDAQNADVARELDALTQRQSLSPAGQLKLRSRFPKLTVSNAAFRNGGDLTFSEASQQ